MADVKKENKNVQYFTKTLNKQINNLKILYQCSFTVATHFY